MLTHGAAIKTTLPSDAKLIGLDLAAYESRSSIVVSIIPKLVLQQGVSKGLEITINGWIYEHKVKRLIHEIKESTVTTLGANDPPCAQRPGSSCQTES